MCTLQNLISVSAELFEWEQKKKRVCVYMSANERACVSYNVFKSVWFGLVGPRWQHMWQPGVVMTTQALQSLPHFPSCMQTIMVDDKLI